MLKRSVKRGPAVIELSFQDDKAAGKMTMNGRERAVAADLGGPLFADAAGGPQAIACLPLAEGYSATFRNFDLQKQKVKLMRLKVAGSETVTVPAGKFETYKVDITPADGGADKMTIWVAKESRKAVKISSVSSQMNGATMTEPV